MAAFRQTMEAFIQPYFLCLFLFCCALVGLYVCRKTAKSRAILSFIFIVLLVISLGVMPRLMTDVLENKYQVIAKVDSNVRWVVVFSGGQSAGDDLPSNTLLYSATLKRLIEGVRIFRQLPDARLLLSGGGYGQDKPEASRLKDVVKLFDIKNKNIRLELNSVNTTDQAREIKKMVGSEPFYLVTSAIHMPRSMALCLKQGLNPIAAPTDFTRYWYDERWQKMWVPNAQNMVYFSIALHEYLGMAWEKLRGKI